MTPGHTFYLVNILQKKPHHIIPQVVATPHQAATIQVAHGAVATHGVAVASMAVASEEVGKQKKKTRMRAFF